MIIRLSGKLARKIHVMPEQQLPLDTNPFADWSCHLFTADRVQYILISNTASLYSIVIFGLGVTDVDPLLRRMFSQLHEVLADDGFHFIAKRHVLPENPSIVFSKALNRSVTGSMNDLVIQANGF